jgi:hypothetical protein
MPPATLWIALPVALVLGGCAPAPLVRSLAPFDGGSLPMRGSADAWEEPPPARHADSVPAAEPAPLGLATQCGGSRGEQARAQCLRGVYGPAYGPP